jgi:hypothetical protein
MESYKAWLRSCVRNEITLEQMMFLYLVKMKDFQDAKSWSNQYVIRVKKFSVEDVVHPLIERDYLINLNQPGEYYPEFLVVSESGDGLFATYMMGQELWDAYPKMLPIGHGGSFVARAGIEKDDLIEEYLRKIDHDPGVHVTVMRKLKVYEAMVRSGNINGHKIVNWVRETMWEVVPDEDKPEFGRIV